MSVINSISCPIHPKCKLPSMDPEDKQVAVKETHSFLSRWLLRM